MRIFGGISIVVMLSLLVFSCAPKPAPFNAAEVRKGIEIMVAKFGEDLVKGDAAAASMVYAEDATVCPPNSPPLKGRKAFQDWFGGQLQSGLKVMDAKLVVESVDGDGTVAYETGRFTEQFEIAGKAIADTGKYLAVWRKLADGSWKVQAEAWNTNMPPPMPEQSATVIKKK
jgi:ketosteroid isomerase-like protein